jgi:hypothetical protein
MAMTVSLSSVTGEFISEGWIHFHTLFQAPFSGAIVQALKQLTRENPTKNAGTQPLLVSPDR